MKKAKLSCRQCKRNIITASGICGVCVQANKADALTKFGASLNLEKFQQFLTLVCEQYEYSAPTVHNYANELYIRINERPRDVRLIELIRMMGLVENGIWEQPNYAANRVYKLMEECGMDTVGQAGF